MCGRVYEKFKGQLQSALNSLWAWGGVEVKALRYYSEGPGCHWGFFPWHLCARGRLSLLK
jgi:hypothetical protein